MVGRSAIILVLAVSTINAQALHDLMTDNEINTIFHVPRHQVPEYERVSVVHKRRKRSEDIAETITLKSENKEIDVYLDPAEDLLAGKNTPVFKVKKNGGLPYGLEYVTVEHALDDVHIYKNLTERVALVIRKVINATTEVFGFLGDIIIHAIPKRLRKVTQWIQNVTGIPEDHLLYKIPKFAGKFLSGLLKRRLSPRTHARNERSSGVIPKTVVPQVLVIVDYALFKTQNENINTALLYLLSFWNAVDLRYSALADPEIKLNIAALIISTEDGGTPYIDCHLLNDTVLSSEDVPRVDADKALVNMSKYFYLEMKLPNYDFAVAMTGLDLCNIKEAYGYSFCDTETMGYAYEAGACNRSDVDRNTEAVGLVEDKGGYSGIILATHEIAHLLGVPHDPLVASPEFDGYIMDQRFELSEKSFAWSNFSKEAFRNFLRTSDAKCLFNIPAHGEIIERISPGAVQSLDAQCRTMFGTATCSRNANVCIRLLCQRPGSQSCVAIAPAAEGSVCGVRMHCANGQCISD